MRRIDRWVPQKPDIAQFKEVVLAKAKKLAFAVGDIYTDIVVYCLTYDFEDEDSAEGRLKYIEEVKEKIVLRLLKCVV